MSTCTLHLAEESDPASVERGRGDDDAGPAANRGAGPTRPIELDGRQIDQLLLEAFARARRRMRGAIVAISDRTMITNTAASELLQPEDRCILWQRTHSDGQRATERDAPCVLA